MCQSRMEIGAFLNMQDWDQSQFSMILLNGEMSPNFN